MPHDSMRIFSEKVMFLEISTSSDRPVPLTSLTQPPLGSLGLLLNHPVSCQQLPTGSQPKWHIKQQQPHHHHHHHHQTQINRESRNHLWLTLKGVVYQVKAFCFGLSAAPKVFTGVFMLMLVWGHQLGVLLKLLRQLAQNH